MPLLFESYWMTFSVSELLEQTSQVISFSLLHDLM